MHQDDSHFYQPIIAPKLTLPIASNRSKPVIIISGPTAVGKTELSLRLAQRMKGEIISADSIQVYKGLDIGAAKPSKEQMQQVPHHLIDICDLCEGYNVSRFYTEAMRAIAQVQARNHVPIVVGGTGFYINSLIYGPPSGPPASAQIREQLEKEVDRLGIEALYQRLEEVDPEYSKKITTGDKQKIIRGLEIMALTGKKVSDFAKTEQRQALKHNFRCFFLYCPREELYPKIEVRCDEMLCQGLIDETQQLIEKGLLDNSSAATSIGYRQCIDYLNSEKGVDDFEYFVSEFKKMTRRYAKRQFTWFRKQPLFRWLDVNVHGLERIEKLIMMDYDNQL